MTHYTKITITLPAVRLEEVATHIRAGSDSSYRTPGQMHLRPPSKGDTRFVLELVQEAGETRDLRYAGHVKLTRSELLALKNLIEDAISLRRFADE